MLQLMMVDALCRATVKENERRLYLISRMMNCVYYMWCFPMRKDLVKHLHINMLIVYI